MLKVFRAIAAAMLLAGVFLALKYAPPIAGPDGEYLGEAFRIVYFHVPSAWISFLMFFLSFAASIAYLVKRNERVDHYAAAFAEVGLVFATIVITTGPIWARAAWGTFWTWEPRLTSFLVLWLMYLGYAILRRTIAEKGVRARTSAVLSIVAFLDVPIVFFAIHLWGSVSHPKPGPDFFGDPAIRLTVQVNLAALLVTAGYFAAKRARIND